ncbi:hypothetical protein JN531_004610 [Flagellatimonas centrodinii]|uniref:hypothetical protein n=1 Tax=Flagellatimonas centrodinii TaxID=2806210 RepID=UPI001FEDBE53|nr:hypothetical protein [Flagellatimonas centrodinii]ULQ47569.1 hypothetical protein JN531_004610 [Flagellatimonas centrodinii]
MILNIKSNWGQTRNESDKLLLTSSGAAQLTFSELETRIEASLPFRQRKALFVSNEKMAGAVMLLGASIALLGANVTPPPYRGFVALFGIGLELFAGVVMIWLTVRREPLSFKDNRAEFAAQLDHDFGSSAKIVEWLSTFPAAVLEARHQYVQQRRATLDQRRRFVVGSLDHLGLLPLIAAIFLQVKDLRGVEPWSIGWIPGLLVIAMIVLYWVGALTFSIKLRLGAYAALLEDALSIARSAGDQVPADASDVCATDDLSSLMPAEVRSDLR